MVHKVEIYNKSNNFMEFTLIILLIKFFKLPFEREGFKTYVKKR
jgi:hypothetical protein